METHVKVLGVLQIALGALALFAAMVLTLVLIGGLGAARASDNPDAALALPFIGFGGSALVIFLLLLSLPGIITGIGLLRLRPWARIAGIVLSILGLTAIPFGTIVGVYGLWVLFSKETERLFATPPTPTSA
ncbi:MAG TPA: hypothetical protein VKD69_19925 [Vicinamibacterales bacterium]|nr:hypothetical protein [Vicinamibacterales bacterium]